MRYVLLAIAMSVCTLLGAQTVLQPRPADETRKGIIYLREAAGSVRLHEDGWAVGLTLGRLKTYYLTPYWHFEIGELKHEKETRSSLDYPSRLNGKVSRAFIYGKQNNLFVLRASYGMKRYYSEKAKKKGAAMGFTWEAGPTLGLLKPYYLEVFSYEGGALPTPITIKYTPETANLFLDHTRIYGSSGWTKGLDELSLVPGIHARGALHFDWGAFDEFVKAVEAGLMVDFFFREVPLMVELPEVENGNLFINLFLTLQFGKRW